MEGRQDDQTVLKSLERSVIVVSNTSAVDLKVVFSKMKECQGNGRQDTGGC